jgi:hypothetical protein
MATSTLAVTYTDVRAALAMRLGWAVPASWTATQELQYGVIIKRAERQLYYPPVLPGEKSPHEWSFLSPWSAISTTSDVADYDLPENFAGMIDDFTYIDYSVGSRTIKLVTDVEIRRLRQMATFGTGYPEMASILPLPSDGDEPQVWQVHFWPTPGGEYQLRYRYAMTPDGITSTKPYPLGGAPFADAYMASVMSAAESELDDKRDIAFVDFIEKLTAAVNYDRGRNIQSLGICRDSSMDHLDGFYSTIPTISLNGEEL